MENTSNNHKNGNNANTVLAAVLNHMAFWEIIGACILIITKIWIENEWQYIINRILLSDLVLFITCMVLYYLCCYKKPEERV
jgi:hypothetical protein